MNSKLSRRGFLAGIAASVVGPAPSKLVTLDLCSAYPAELTGLAATSMAKQYLYTESIIRQRLILAKAMNSIYGKMGNPPRYYGGRYVETT